jgi:phosphoribosylaminoimidazole-succinocarboxamide synthase
VSIQLYERAAAHALSRGIIIADSKFEFGLDESGVLTLMDEILTPDSSRFWDVESYVPGRSPPSFDKQIIRDWLESAMVDGRPWNKMWPAPEVPADVVQRMSALYEVALERLKGGSNVPN